MLDTEKLTILNDVLATTDVLFGVPRQYSSPARSLPNSVWAAVSERQSDFRTQGVPYVASGGANERKQAERTLGEMQSDGLLRVFTKTGRRHGVALTDRGDDIARFLAAEFLAYQSWPLLARIAKLRDAGVSRGDFVAEVDIAQTEYGAPGASSKLLSLEADHLPLAARGLVESTSDSQGRVWYGLTPAGEAAAKQPAPKPTDLPEYQSGYCDRHTAAVEQGIIDRLNWTPTNPALVVIPLSCGVGAKRIWQELTTKERRSIFGPKPRKKSA